LRRCKRLTVCEYSYLSQEGQDIGLTDAYRRVEFLISDTEINGPFNLNETVLSAQTSEPEWTVEGQKFTDVEELDGVPVKYSLCQEGNTDRYVVNVKFITTSSINETERRLRAHIERVLGLSDDLNSFYMKFHSEYEPLRSTFRMLRGLRLMRGTNLYESLVCSILSQNNSAKRWNQIARLLMKHYGRHMRLPDGSSHFLFPSPSKIAKLTARELRAKTSIGYRAECVVEISRMIANDELNLEDFRKYSYEEALEILLQFYGVGPKVADCFLLYGVGKMDAAPVDVWMHRIVTELYFKGRNVSRVKAASFLRERFGDWAGYAQLYLFDYARRRKLG